MTDTERFLFYVMLRERNFYANSPRFIVRIYCKHCQKDTLHWTQYRVAICPDCM